MRYLNELTDALKAQGIYDDAVKAILSKSEPGNKSKNKFYVPSLILNDRGLSKAFQNGSLKSNTPIQDVQLQPASLDCKIKNVKTRPGSVALIGQFGEGQSMNQFGVPAYTRATFTLTQAFNYDSDFFQPQVIMRSSLGRLGLAPLCFTIENVYGEEPKSEVSVANFSPNDIAFRQNDRVCQIIWRLLFNGHDIKGSAQSETKRKTAANLISSLESGIEVHDDSIIYHLHKANLFSVQPELNILYGAVVLHASNEAYRMKKSGTVKLGDTKDDLLEAIDISNGYTPQPGEHIIVKAREYLKLSDKVAIHFIEKPVTLITGTDERASRKRFQIFSTNLVNAAWFDPGYEGIYTAHVKNVDMLPVDIRPGDPIGFGRVFYFPKGVERSYGQKELKSKYQNSNGFNLL